MEARRGSGTIVLPAYNEEFVIGKAISALDALCMEQTEREWEIIVVDDGSTDGTSAAVAEAASTGTTLVRALRHPRNRRLGGALRTGLLASRGDIVLTVDSDLSYSVATVKRLIAEFDATGADIVVASPYMPGGQTREVPAALEFRSRAANKWLRLTSLDDIHTLTGMVRAYRGDFIRSMSIKAVDVDINAEIIYKAQVLRASIVEIPAVLDWSHLRTRAGRSRLLAKRARTNTVKQVINGYLWRPFLFPLVAGLFCLAGAVVASVVGGLSLTGIALAGWSVGIILVFQMLSTLQAKRYFEELYFGLNQLRRVLPSPPADAIDLRARPPQGLSGDADDDTFEDQQ